jgi:hypothetical protein
MSSLVVSASPYGQNEEYDESDIMRVRSRNNRTLKKAPENRNKKVSNLLTKMKAMSIGADPDSGDEDEDNMADFVPPPAPVSAGVEKTKRESRQTMDVYGENDVGTEYNGTEYNGTEYNGTEKYPQQFPHLATERVNDDDIDDEMNFFQNRDRGTVPSNGPNIESGGGVDTDQSNEYATPYMMAQGAPLIEGYRIGNKDFSNRGEEVGDLEKKINYVINLLEEQQDHESDHIIEELILYCFLGVFIIFIVDSFARASKYTR